MLNGLEPIVEMEYPGRLIIIGKDGSGENNIVVYAVTGRSQSSQARTLEIDRENSVIYTEPTDRKKLEQGSPVLLIYPAIMQTPNGNIAVSNGWQTNLINTALRSSRSGEAYVSSTAILDSLYNSFLVFDKKPGLIDVTSHEPDTPNFTPRIAGWAIKDYACLFIARRGENNEVEKKHFAFDYTAGEGKMIATYTGVNQDPLLPFAGKPLDVRLEGKTPKEVAEDVYEALGPKESEDDFRVAVAVVFANKSGHKSHIINRHENKQILMG